MAISPLKHVAPDGIKPCKTYGGVDAKQELFNQNLSGKNKKKLIEFINAWNVVSEESNLDSFIMRFGLGANFTYDIFVSEGWPFTDLSKEAYGKKSGTEVKRSCHLSNYRRVDAIMPLNNCLSALLSFLSPLLQTHKTVDYRQN